MAKLDKNEEKLLESFDNDEWVSVDSFESKKNEYQTIARNTMQKNRRINIRLSEKDLDGIKIKAMEEGIPYQTLISSIIHKSILRTYLSCDSPEVSQFLIQHLNFLQVRVKI